MADQLRPMTVREYAEWHGPGWAGFLHRFGIRVPATSVLEPVLAETLKAIASGQPLTHTHTDGCQDVLCRACGGTGDRYDDFLPPNTPCPRCHGIGEEHVEGRP